jgi:hypothetical protein
LGGEGLSSKCVEAGFEERSKGEIREIKTCNIVELILRYDRLGYLLHCIIPQVDQYPRMGAHILY